jgi:hypothetical protein
MIETIQGGASRRFHQFAARAAGLAIIMSLAGGAVLAQSGPTTADLVLWLEADNGLATDGSAWTDQSGSGHNATALAGEAPTYLSGALNGLPVASFNGSSQAMSIAGKVLTKQKFTILAVVTDTSVPGAFHEIVSNWDGTTTVNSIFLGTVWGVVNAASADRIRFTDVVGGADQGDTGQGDIKKPTSPFVLSGVSSSNNAVIRLGPKIQYSLGTALPRRNLTKAWFLGKQGSSSFEYWQGYIAEVLIYNDVLSAAELKTDLTYLEAKWLPPKKLSDSLKSPRSPLR